MTAGRRSCPGLSLQGTPGEAAKRAILVGLMRAARACSRISLRGRVTARSHCAIDAESIAIVEGSRLRHMEVSGSQDCKSPASTISLAEGRREICRMTPSTAIGAG